MRLVLMSFPNFDELPGIPESIDRPGVENGSLVKTDCSAMTRMTWRPIWNRFENRRHRNSVHRMTLMKWLWTKSFPLWFMNRRGKKRVTLGKRLFTLKMITIQLARVKTQRKNSKINSTRSFHSLAPLPFDGAPVWTDRRTNEPTNEWTSSDYELNNI